eukprot:scaffold152536_cov30-Tisochrysis_lutea.AAC.2
MPPLIASAHRKSAASRPGAPCEKARRGSHASISTRRERDTLQSAAMAYRMPAGEAAPPVSTRLLQPRSKQVRGVPSTRSGRSASARSGSARTAADGTSEPRRSMSRAACTPWSSDATSACPAPSAACKAVGAPAGAEISAAPHRTSWATTPACPPLAAATKAP